MANGAIYDDDGQPIRIHDRKLDALEDLIEGANGKPVLVAYWFKKHDLDRIKARFKVREIKTSADIRDWNAGKIPVAVILPLLPVTALTCRLAAPHPYLVWPLHGRWNCISRPMPASGGRDNLRPWSFTTLLRMVLLIITF